MSAVQRMFKTFAGKVLVTLVVLALVCLAGYSIFSFFRGDNVIDASLATFVCSETGKPFPHRNAIGEMPPVMSPYSGKNTGYPAEPCFWTAAGTIRTEPYWVILNSTLGKPGPTFCPDCGRLVLPRAAHPQVGSKPPPTREEYLAKSAE